MKKESNNPSKLHNTKYIITNAIKKISSVFVVGKKNSVTNNDVKTRDFTNENSWTLVNAVKDAKAKKKKKSMTIALASILGIGAIGYGYEKLTDVENINFIKDREEILIGEAVDTSFELEPKIAKYKSMEFVFDNPDLVEFNGTSYYGIADGSTDVHIVCDGKEYGEKHLNINPIEIEKISCKNLTVSMGDEVEIPVIISPVNATHKECLYRIDDTSIADTKSNDGIITGKKEGTTTLHISSANGIKTTCLVNVVPVEAENISVSIGYSRNISSIDICEGDQTDLLVSFEPKNTTYKDLEFISSNVGVFDVDQNGHLLAISRGSALLTVRHNDKVYKDISVNVEYPRPNKIIISSQNNNIYKGDEIQLYANITPNNYYYDGDAVLSWSSSNENVASVDNKGVVIGKDEGTAIIICAGVGLTSTYEVKVKPKQVYASINTSEDITTRNIAQNSNSYSYVLNTNTGKFHLPGCRDIKKMKDKNKAFSSLSRDEIIGMGYSPCGHCHP